jgi:hypothetical protein
VTADPLDEDDLATIIDRRYQTVIVAFDVEHYPVGAHDAGGRVNQLYLHQVPPPSTLDFMKPTVERCLDCPLSANRGQCELLETIDK